MNSSSEIYSRFAGVFANRSKVAIVSGINREYSNEPGALRVDHCFESNGLSEKSLRHINSSLPSPAKVMFLDCSDGVLRALRKIVCKDLPLQQKRLEKDSVEDILDNLTLKINADNPIIQIDNLSLRRRLENCPANIADIPDEIIFAFLVLCECVFSRTKIEFRATQEKSIYGQLQGYGNRTGRRTNALHQGGYYSCESDWMSGYCDDELDWSGY